MPNKALQQINRALEIWIQHNLPTLIMVARVLSEVSLAMWALFCIMVVIKLPVKIKMGGVRIDGLIKFMAILLILGWTLVSIAAVAFLPLLIVAKLGLIELLVVAIIVTWILLLSSGPIYRQLNNAIDECELATNLTFLESDRARTQLEALKDKLDKTLNPPQIALGETIFKSAAPILKLVTQRETSILKWGVAAAMAYKNISGYLSGKEAKK